ncbi:MAG TPA: Gfo/Idh/MocA family oxidoreductase [Candidatus Baltobacteraceae bacterium]|nr:Gfo/Idh/MocA family oxidoreductase [Candidatus Baltobacteraceae bacterium]
MKYPLRFAIVGTGGIAAAYEAAFRTLTRARVTAVCDVRMSAAEAFAGRIGCDAFASPEYLVRYGHFDAAVVCTPPATHEAVATLLLEHGKHVLCEKPLATTVPSAWRMLEAARRNDSVLTMASKFRYVADVRKAHDLVAQGTVGDLIFVENAFTSRVDMRNRWNSDASVSGGGVLIDNGTHAVDVLRYFLGNLRDVQIVEGLRIQGLPVEDTVRLFVHNDTGVMGSSDLSWSIDKELESFLRIYGSEGTIVVGWAQSKYRRRDEREWQTFGNGYDKVQAFCAQIENFCDALEGRCELVITARDALASVEVIRAAYAALERARWERVGTHYDEVDLSQVAERETLEVS